MTSVPFQRAGLPGRIAALSHEGETVHAVVLSRTRTAYPEFVASESLPIAPGALPALLARHRVEGVVHVVPTPEVAVRVRPLPDAAGGDAAGTAGALRLLGEAEWPTHVPPHRRAAIAIPPRATGNAWTAVLAAWVGTGTTRPELPAVDLPRFYVPEPLALVHAGVAADADMVILADAASGVLLLGMSGGADRGYRVRALREEPGGADWPEVVLGHLRDTLEADTPAPALALDPTGRTVAFLRSGAPVPLASRADPAWISRFAGPWGAASLFLTQGPLLAHLRGEGPARRRSILHATVEALSRPRIAAGVLAMSAAVALGAPLAAAAARAHLLERRVAEAGVSFAGLDDAALRAARYQQLQSERWPMTKLLADIAGAAPVGVRLTSLSLARAEKVRMEGAAESVALVNGFRANLAGTRIFDDVRTGEIQATGDAVQFTLEAGVARPLTVAKPAEDFADTPLRVRLYGERGRDARPPAVERGTRRETEARPGSGRNADRTRADVSGGAAIRAAPATTPPEPLTDEAIAALTADQAMKEWARRKGAAGAPGLDAATKERLLAEAEKSRLRMQEARRAGGGTP